MLWVATLRCDLDDKAELTNPGGGGGDLKVPWSACRKFWRALPLPPPEQEVQSGRYLGVAIQTGMGLGSALPQNSACRRLGIETIHKQGKEARHQ